MARNRKKAVGHQGQKRNRSPSQPIEHSNGLASLEHEIENVTDEVIEECPTISPQVQEKLRKLPAEARAAVLMQMQVSSGPLPSPEILERYDQVVPGLADRIVGWAEAEATHRRSLEVSSLRGDIVERRTGQWLGFFIGVFALVAGVAVIILGSGVSAAVVGGLFGTTGIGSLVGAFLYSNRRESESNNPKGEGKS